MESLGTALVLLVQFWGATGLRVQQEPKWLQATQGSQVTLACQVIQSQIWERLRVEWTKDGVSLCEPHITNGSLSLGACGPRGQLSWKPPDSLTLWLDHVSLNDSGDYVCSVTVEIPRLNTNRGNGTHLLVEKGGGSANQTSTDAGLPVAPLVAGGVAVAAIALSAWVWGRCRSRREDSASQPPAAPGPEDLPQPQVESPYIYCRRLP